MEKCLFSSLAHFLIGSFIFLELSCRSCLYILKISCLSVASFAIIFSHSEGCLFTLLIVSFDGTTVYSEIDSCGGGTDSEGQKPDYTGFKNKSEVKMYSNKMLGQVLKKKKKQDHSQREMLYKGFFCCVMYICNICTNMSS